MKKHPILFIFVTLFGISCNLFRSKEDIYNDWIYTSTESVISTDESWTGENEILPSQYREARQMDWQLMHTELSLDFDFENRSAEGFALLTLKPYWNALDSIVLDAKGMRIQSVWIIDSSLVNGSIAPLQTKLDFRYTDTSHLHVKLSKTFTRTDILTIKINYSAHPYEFEPESGGMAISSERGLYFINHLGHDPSIPRQIWTQGETESSSRWFPTLDAPNQKTTLKISLHVPDSMTTLSNGTLLKTTASNKSGHKVDVWEQKLPHAPYLTMIAIGNWSTTKDIWRGKEVNYMVEKKYAKYADLIFGKTPEMMEFFSNYTGVDFPWDKYSQVVVRNFVSGAMENTSAVVHMEQLQHNDREHLDNTYEDYVSHELFHHWFGDITTAESWANISLNESFATYGQYLWKEHAYGRAKADESLEDFRQDYLFLGMNDDKKLIRYNFHNRDDVFDAVSYQKGACILHMLRQEIGDEAFRESMKRYLNTFRFKSAEVHDWRLIVENVTGKDMNYFFDEWYFGKSHPVLRYRTTEMDGKWLINITQEQQHRNTYKLSFEIAWKSGGKVHKKRIGLNSRFTQISLPEEPEWVVLDANNELLAEFFPESPDRDGYAVKIQELHKAFQHEFPEGTKYKLFAQAARLVSLSPDESSIAAMSPLLQLALKSQFSHTISRALSYSSYVENLHKPDYHGIISLQKRILHNSSLPSHIRKEALMSLHYTSPDSLDLRSLTKDPSILLAGSAIEMLPFTEEIKTYALAAIGTETENNLIAIWIQKFIENKNSGLRTAFEQMLNNPSTDVETVKNTTRSFLSIAFNFDTPSDELVYMYETATAKRGRIFGKAVAAAAEAELEYLNFRISDLNASGVDEKLKETILQILEKAY